MSKLYYNILNGSVKIITNRGSFHVLSENGLATILHQRAQNANHFHYIIHKLLERKRRLHEAHKLLIETKIEAFLTKHEKNKQLQD